MMMMMIRIYIHVHNLILPLYLATFTFQKANGIFYNELETPNFHETMNFTVFEVLDEHCYNSRTLKSTISVLSSTSSAFLIGPRRSSKILPVSVPRRETSIANHARSFQKQTNNTEIIVSIIIFADE